MVGENSGHLDRVDSTSSEEVEEQELMEEQQDNEESEDNNEDGGECEDDEDEDDEYEDDEECEDEDNEEDEDDDEEDEDDNHDNDEKENESSDGDDDDAEKSGWADAMAKVLNIGKNLDQDPKKLLLSKARKDCDVESMKKTKTTEDQTTTSSSEKKLLLIRRRKEIESIGRTKPDIVKDKIRERTLNKLATRGVVQLFNAVRVQQKDLKTQLNSVGYSARKREKVYQNIDKQGFLDNVIGGGGKSSDESSLKKRKLRQEPKVEIKEEDMDTTEQSSWNILRDDFMMGAKMKDWDKNSDSE